MSTTKETQIIAIYGKGGIGKSFTLANLSYMMAQQGKKVLLIGCDPKSDTTSLLFGGKATPTIIETSSKKKLAGEEVAIGDVCFKRDGVFAMELGGNVGVAGMVINKDDGTGEAAAFAQKVGIPVLAAIPAHEDIRRKSASYEIVGKPGGTWGPLFETLGNNVAEAPPVRPTPLSQDELLGLFASDTVGRNVVLQPATLADMMGADVPVRQSLEVVYETV